MSLYKSNQPSKSTLLSLLARELGCTEDSLSFLFDLSIHEEPHTGDINIPNIQAVLK